MEAKKRSDVDDTPSAAKLIWLAREHVCAYLAAQREDCREVYLQDFVPVVVRELVRWVAPLDAAAVEEDVDGLA